MSRILASIRSRLADPLTREFFAWCLPALLIGLALRIILMWQLPYAYFHDDTPDFLATPDKLLFEHKWELHAKKTFLVPAVFTIPFLLRIPALIAIPVFQHLLGLITVVGIGLLCRLWFKHWKIAIVPLTVLAAINPFFLWYEHTLMAESIFVFCTVLVAIAGTVYALDRTVPKLIFLAVALFLEAGARPEGKLLFGFGLFLLVLLHWREWRLMWPRFAAIFVLAVFTHFVTKTSQAGLLLYTSVVRLTPTHLKLAPKFEPYIAPVRADLQTRWDERPQFPKVKDRRAVAEAVERYLKENPEMKSEKGHRSVNEFCLKLATETCRRNFFYLPVHIYHKFRLVSNDSPAGLLDNAWLFRKQREAYGDGDDRLFRLIKGITGEDLKSVAEINGFIDRHYGEVPWLTTLSDNWLATVNFFHFPDTKFDSDNRVTPYPGVPCYFLVAGLGVIIVMFRRGVLQPLHVAWGLTLLAYFYTIILTANVRPRFRFVFEPFWFIYIGLLIETVILALTAPLRRK